MTHPPLVGIVGGYGPATSAAFCSALVRYAQALHTDFAPSFALDSVPISFADATRCIAGDLDATRSLVSGINAAIERLCTLGVRTIAVPCNSVHVLVDDFHIPPGVTFIHIADPVIDRVRRSGAKRVGLLATGLTVSQGIYSKRIQAAKLNVYAPAAEAQTRLNAYIADFVATGKVHEDSCRFLQEILSSYAEQKLDAVILGCTDLGCMLEIARIHSPVPLDDSMDALAEVCAKKAFKPGI